MATMSELISNFLMQMVSEAGGQVSLSRSELAERFSCVPSQINYVLTTRFTPENGYQVESRRGGGGYIRISRVSVRPEALLMHAVNAVGEEIDAATARAFLQNLFASGALDANTARTVAAAISDAALRPAPVVMRPALRASVLKQCLIEQNL